MFQTPYGIATTIREISKALNVYAAYVLDAYLDCDIKFSIEDKTWVCTSIQFPSKDKVKSIMRDATKEEIITYKNLHGCLEGLTALQASMDRKVVIEKARQDLKSLLSSYNVTLEEINGSKPHQKS